MHFVLHKSKNFLTRGQRFYFTLESPNGQVVMTSEMYHRSNDAMDTIMSIKRSLRFNNVLVVQRK